MHTTQTVAAALQVQQMRQMPHIKVCQEVVGAVDVRDGIAAHNMQLCQQVARDMDHLEPRAQLNAQVLQVAVIHLQRVQPAKVAHTSQVLETIAVQHKALQARAQVLKVQVDELVASQLNDPQITAPARGRLSRL
jgi:hypothetical protein